jgi:hypothetical protein
MISLADLHRAVTSTLAGNRIGQPVFVRYLLHQPEPSESVVDHLAQLSATVHDWIAQPLDRVYALGSLESGHVSLSLQFRNGATALVSLAQGGPQPGGVDLLVLGNHGAIYHETAGPAVLDLDARADRGICSLIARALISGQPETAP